MTKDSSVKYKLNPEMITLKQGEASTVVFSASNEEKFHRINGLIACEAFELLKDGKLPSGIVKTIAKNHTEAPSELLEKDLSKFTQKLIKLKILVAS